MDSEGRFGVSTTDLFSLRESEIFTTLRSVQAVDAVLIGGYAVNAYARARYSVDCDVVVPFLESDRIQSILSDCGFQLKTRSITGGPYAGSFMGFEKPLATGFAVTFDVLVDEVLDRRTRASFSSEWIRKHSGIRRLSAKTYPDSLALQVVNADALVVMKLVAGRVSDFRDVFMLAPAVDAAYVHDEISKRMDAAEAFSRAEKTILSKQFRNNLQGVFGYVEEKVFDAHIRAYKKLAAHPKP